MEKAESRRPTLLRTVPCLDAHSSDAQSARLADERATCLVVLRVDGRQQQQYDMTFRGEGSTMRTDLPGLPGLTVEELIQVLQRLADEGSGSLPAHALMGDLTGPIRGAGAVPSWGAENRTVVLIMADEDDVTATTGK
ncbi:hypothetical protein [Cupriavidus sp. D384]|uniref:hypothetical protein n=1 Tax=Cupriavidus sp. D384 TaxID=1538095 RepID=UPI0018D49336|nr:hypothetical protein [Cupriavidus sp. D384]